MVLFLCKNKSSRNGTELCEEFFITIIRISGAKTHQRGGPGWAQHTRACPSLLAHPGGLYPPGGPADLNPDTKNFYFQRKNREKELSHSTRRSRRHLLFFFGRPDLESVWGSGEGDLRSSSSPTLLHHQFHDAPHRE